MKTWQDYEKAQNKLEFLASAIADHTSGADWRIATQADAYDRQANVTINKVARLVNGEDGGQRIASNFFHRLNVQRCSYLLGNGVSFAGKATAINAEGQPVQVDAVKDRLGPGFDTALYDWGYKALIHGVAFGYWQYDRLRVFPLTQFVPLWDEQTGALRAGLRFWRLEAKRPLQAEFYEPDGFTVLSNPRGATGNQLEIVQEKRAYIHDVSRTGGGEIVGEAWRNYPGLPVIPMWGSSLRQSTLVGMRGGIDAFDLIKSGFADTMQQAATIYWLIENHGGMTDDDLRQFLLDIREKHIAKVDTGGFTGDARGALAPYVQDVPYQGANNYLDIARKQIYEDFGGLDVHAIAASSTNDHIDAAYQPMDEEADDFETQVIEAVQALLRLMGIEDTPIFKRNRISNVKEQMDAIMMASAVLDPETLVELMPILTVDQKAAALMRMDVESYNRLNGGGGE